MTQRISRRYTWSEIQELARDVRATIRSSSQTALTREEPRVARVERIRAHLGEELLERTASPQSSPPEDPTAVPNVERAEPKRLLGASQSPDLKAFKEAWSRSVGTAPAQPSQPPASNPVHEPVSISTSAHPAKLGHPTSAPSPWDLLRDHFIEQRRLRIAREEQEPRAGSKRE